jgi:hypothetical protein
VRTREVPDRVVELLLAGFNRHWAHWQLAALRDQGGYQPGTVVHPGDPFGTVLAWLWSQDRDEAAEFVAEYMALLRVHDELVPADGALVRFDHLLASLEMAMPDGFEADSLIAYLRSRVPRFYGASDPNS